jgi:hypothetical protein
MTPVHTDAITRDRFSGWARILKRHAATPILAVGVSHGEHSGTVHVVQVEDMGNEELLAFLRFAVAELERKGGGS